MLKELEKWQKNKEEGLEALAERQKRLDLAKKAESEGPRLIEEANAKLAKARAETQNVLEQIGLNDVLIQGNYDEKLAKFFVLKEATPKGLALFA